VRPLYGELAAAYDLIVPSPAGPSPERVAALLTEHEVGPAGTVVDAGCGTGRYAGALHALGSAVTALDRSAALLARAPEGVDRVCADLLTWRPSRPVDAVLCRGVLNDIVSDRERDGAFAAFAAWLQPGRVLVADVRDWAATARRYGPSPAPVVRDVEADGLRLRFTATTALDPARHARRVRDGRRARRPRRRRRGGPPRRSRPQV